VTDAGLKAMVLSFLPIVRKMPCLDVDQQAAQQDRENRILLANVLALLLPILNEAQQHAIVAWKIGHNIADAAADTVMGNDVMDGAAPIFLAALIASNLSGRRRIISNVTERTDIDPLVLLLLFDDDDPDLVIAGLREDYRVSAENIARNMSLRLHDALDELPLSELPVGSPPQPSVPGQIVDAMARAGLGVAIPERQMASYNAETVADATVGIGYTAGKKTVLEYPAVKKSVAAYIYKTKEDSRVRPTHAQMEGVARPVDDPLWESWTPKCGFNCRCWLVEIYVGEDYKFTEVLPPVEPDPGWHGGQYLGPGFMEGPQHFND
jgi:SPP1 gp7 family putative phage head morphogenesis protein